jgi:hypothetical protein
MTRLLLVGALVAFMATSCGMCGRELSPSMVKEISSERIDRNGDTWQVQFTSKFAAPPDKVYDAFTHPERVKEYVPENVLKSELVSAEGNKKTVDVVGRLDILPPGFKVQNLRIEYTYYPEEKRITSRTIDFKLADINSEYRFEPAPDGKGTILEFSQTSKDKAPMIVESLQKGALRENYATQVKAAKRALGLDEKEPASKTG